MSKKILEEIVDSIRHLAERVHAFIEIDKLIDGIKKLENLDFNDTENAGNRAKSHIKLAEKKYQAGLLSEQEYIFHQYHAVVSLIHETRWLNVNYSNELNPIDEKMRDIEKSHGLADDEYWPKGNAPHEYQLLNQHYEKVLETKLEAELKEFASGEVYDLFINDRSKLEVESELGRRSIFVKDEIKRLNELALVYERIESK